MGYLLCTAAGMRFIALGKDSPADARLCVEEIGHSRPFGGKDVTVRARSWHIHCLVSGRGLLDGRPIGAGQGFVVRPGEEYRQTADEREPFEQYWINFTGSEAEGLLDRARLSGTFAFEDAAAVRAAFEEAFSSDMPGLDSGLLPAALLLRLLTLYGKKKPDPNDGGESAVARVMRLVRFRCGEALSVRELAAEVGLSEKYLSRLFHRQTGRTLCRFIAETRLESAYLLLVHTNKSVSDIARETGYADALYFSRAFHAFFGCPPSAVRGK